MFDVIRHMFTIPLQNQRNSKGEKDISATDRNPDTGESPTLFDRLQVFLGEGNHKQFGPIFEQWFRPGLLINQV